VFAVAVEAQKNRKFCFASMWKMMQVSRTCGHNVESNFEVPVSDGCMMGAGCVHAHAHDLLKL